MIMAELLPTEYMFVSILVQVCGNNAIIRQKWLIEK